jgi:hypothetical protein
VSLREGENHEKPDGCGCAAALAQHRENVTQSRFNVLHVDYFF